MSNECYRLAFYLSGASDRALVATRSTPTSSPTAPGGCSTSGPTTSPIYHRHLERVAGHRRRGCSRSACTRAARSTCGSTTSGPTAVLVGVDIDEAAIRMADPRRTIVLGDQADPEFLRSVVDQPRARSTS